MSSPISKPLASKNDSAADYSSEIRFGVVMYGGVSLAIYINGVANELFEMACATPRLGVILDRAGESATRDIYRRLAWLMGNRELRERYAERLERDLERRRIGEAPTDVWDPDEADQYQQTRLVIDVIAGTSAGGINGVFLAKALANGEKFCALKDMWVNEGDIGLLLNDQRSYSSTLPPLVNRSAKPTSLLNSDRMYIKLLAAMKAMQPLNIKFAPYSPGASPLVEEIDLFVTTTDIVGAPVPLRLFDKVVYERRYKQSYRFNYPNGVSIGGNDFVAINQAFLAFAARCTSSFPFAFEPMTLKAVMRLNSDGPAPVLARWNAFFPNLPADEVADGAHVHRAFGDGGYLDNKPFTYVVETLSTRFSSVPIERKLLYVEPSPQQLDPHERPDPNAPPDALSNSIAALTRIPQYETIREDLQSVLQRNRRIERVERIVRQGENDIESHSEGDPFTAALRSGATIPRWASLKLSEMARFYGLAFLPYQRLRVAAVTDTLADQVGARWGIDRNSDNQYALRALLRVWREDNFDDEGVDERETINAYLDQFDLDYRLRRLGFMLRKTDLLARQFRRRGLVVNALKPDDGPPKLSESDHQMVEQIAARLPARFSPFASALDEETRKAALLALRLLKDGLIEIRLALLQARRSFNEVSPEQLLRYQGLGDQLKQVLGLVLGARSAKDEPVVLEQTPGRATAVKLDPRWENVASSSRTLQESVYLRARALMRAARSEQQTAIQIELEVSLDAMRIKGSERHPDHPDPELNRISARAWTLLGKPHLALADDAATLPRVEVQVGPALSNTGEDARDAARNAALNSEIGSALRGFLSEYYLRFDSFDQISFPLYYDTGTGEPSTVEVVRVSPQDATHLIDESSDALHRRKLAGTALGNFGAFLDRRWRLNDIMWGRLDGAERLIEVLLPMADPATVMVRNELIALAHGRILREALVPEGHGTLTELLCKALEEIPEGGVEQRLNTLLTQLKLGDAPSRDRLSDVLCSLLSEQGLIDFVRERRQVDPVPDPKTTLDSAARAVTITGRVLEGISRKQGKGVAASRWLARLGLTLQGVVAVSLPGTLINHWWSHGLKVLYAFELVALVLALVLGSGDMRTLAITAIGVTLGMHLLTLVAGDLMRNRSTWLRLALFVLLIILFFLAGLGAMFILQTSPDVLLAR
jgi:patatin-related protein